MTEPLDVSLRVKLAYEAAGGAKAAISDREPTRARVAELGPDSAAPAIVRDFGEPGVGDFEADPRHGTLVDFDASLARLNAKRAARRDRLQRLIFRAVRPAP